VIVLCAAGTVLAGYLTFTKLAGATPLLCQAGTACDIVQGSQYSLLLGLPVALWGAGLFALLGALAAIPFTPRRWLLSFALAASGVGFSLYLTGVALWVLSAACAWCLASAALMVLALGALLRHRPPVTARRPWLRPARLAAVGVVAAAAVVGLAIAASREGARGTDYQEALARHLAATGARMYGAYWCPACRHQKELFGSAAERLPYVECDPRGAGAQPGECARLGVNSYPTWTIKGGRREGVLSLDELARASDFTPPAPAPSR
jgi:uncharacterized membrane protein